MKEGPQPSVETWKYKASDEGLHGGHLPDDNSESQIPHCSYWVINIHFRFLADYFFIDVQQLSKFSGFKTVV